MDWVFKSHYLHKLFPWFLAKLYNTRNWIDRVGLALTAIFLHKQADCREKSVHKTVCVLNKIAL